MAKVSLSGFWCAKYGETDTGITLTNGKKLAKAIEYAPTAQVNEATLYGDNTLDSKVRAISSIDITITPTEVDETIYELTGVVEETKNVNGEEIKLYTINTNNQGEYTAVGVIIGSMSENKMRYTAEIHPKCIFTPNTDDSAQTMQGGSISFSNSTVKGTAYTDKNGDYRWIKSFETENEAITFLDDLFGVGGGTVIE